MIYFDEEERARIVSGYKDAHKKMVDLDFEVTRMEEPSEEILGEYGKHMNLSGDLFIEYIKKVPIVPLSRCPWTHQVVYHSFDMYGLDGLWWNHDSPGRPMEAVPSTVIPLQGAVQVKGPVPETDFKVTPGPGKPYVIPKLLEKDGIKAVISSIGVGNSIAYPIFYFAEDTFVDWIYTPNWGTSFWSFTDKLGGTGIVEDTDRDDIEYDFNLEPWIRENKILWISPGDTYFTLKEGLENCPYLNVEGTEHKQILFDGKIKEEEA